MKKYIFSLVLILTIIGSCIASELIYGRVLEINKDKKMIKIYDIYNEKELSLTYSYSNDIKNIKKGEKIRIWISSEKENNYRKVIKICRRSFSDLTGIKRRLRRATHSKGRELSGNHGRRCRRGGKR